MKVVQKLSVMEKAVFLSETDLFQDVPSEEIASIAASTDEVLLDAGEVLEAGSERWDHFQVVVTGEIEISQHGLGWRRTTKGMEFGLLPLLGQPDPVVFKALEPSHTIALSPSEFRCALADSPDFALGVIRRLALGLQEALGQSKERTVGK